MLLEKVVANFHYSISDGSSYSVPKRSHLKSSSKHDHSLLQQQQQPQMPSLSPVIEQRSVSQQFSESDQPHTSANTDTDTTTNTSTDETPEISPDLTLNESGFSTPLVDLSKDLNFSSLLKPSSLVLEPSISSPNPLPSSTSVAVPANERSVSDKTLIDSPTSIAMSQLLLGSKSNSLGASNGPAAVTSADDEEEENSLSPITTATTHCDDPSDDQPQTVAQAIYDGNFRQVNAVHYASYLGDSGDDRAAVLSAFMALFDWESLSVLGAIRGLCNCIYVKAESQQLDRIIEAFAERWCDCNPTHGFRNQSVVYTLAYSILLLNTDHHAEEYAASKKMPRSQYVSSTLRAMTSLAQADWNVKSGKADTKISNQAGNEKDTSHHQTIKHKQSSEFGSTTENQLLVTNPSSDLSFKDWEAVISSLLKSIYASVDMTPLSIAKSSSKQLVRTGSQSSLKRQSGIFSNKSLTARRSSWMPGNSVSTPTWENEFDLWDSQQSMAPQNRGKAANKRASVIGALQPSATLNSGNDIGFRGALWSSIIREEQEKEFFENNTKPEKIPLTHRSSSDLKVFKTRSLSNLSINQHQKQSSNPNLNHKKSTGNLSGIELRSVKSFYSTTGTGMAGSTAVNGDTLVSDVESELGPATMQHARKDSSSSTCPSIPESPSMTSFKNGTSFAAGQQTSMGLDSMDLQSQPDAEEELALMGAPWAKEGLLKFQVFYHKNTDSRQKGIKTKGWNEVFVVVQKGYLKMFQFEKDNTPSPAPMASPQTPHDISKKKRFFSGFRPAKAFANAMTNSNNKIQVGSGNWTDHATLIGSISLCHTVSHIIPLQKDGTDVLGVLPGSSTSVSSLSSTSTSKRIKSAAHNGNNVQWCITLPNSGGVVVFLAGTREIADEYVYTCNYWAARVSRDPLLGLVSSHEYGWNKVLEIIFGADLLSKIESMPADPTLLGSESTETHNSVIKSKKSLPDFVNKQSGSNVSTLTPSSSSTSQVSPNAVNQARMTLRRSSIDTHTGPLSSAAEMSTAATAAASSFYGLRTGSSNGLMPTSPAKLQYPLVTKRIPVGIQVFYGGNRFNVIPTGTVHSDTMYVNNNQIRLGSWPTPVHSLVVSEVSEAEQLEKVSAYGKLIDSKLMKHGRIRDMMFAVYGGETNQHPGLAGVHQRAKQNWENKCRYLWFEVLKCDIYVATLVNAIRDRERMTLKKI